MSEEIVEPVAEQLAEQSPQPTTETEKPQYLTKRKSKAYVAQMPDETKAKIEEMKDEYLQVLDSGKAKPMSVKERRKQSFVAIRNALQFLEDTEK